MAHLRVAAAFVRPLATRDSKYVTDEISCQSNLPWVCSAHPLTTLRAVGDSSIQQSTPATLPSDAQSNEPMAPDAVFRNVFSVDSRPIILFDGVCNLCNGAVNLALDWDPKGKLRFAALQSAVGRSLLKYSGRRPDDISSIVVVSKNGKAYTKSDAILTITEELTPVRLLPLKPGARVARYLVPKLLRDVIYDSVADNRYDLLGKRDTCRFDADGSFEDRFVKDDLAYER